MLDLIFFNAFIIGEWFEPRSHFIRPSHFFCLASNAFPDIGSVGQVEKKT